MESSQTLQGGRGRDSPSRKTLHRVQNTKQVYTLYGLYGTKGCVLLHSKFSGDLEYCPSWQLLVARHRRLAVGVEHRLVVAREVAYRPVMVAQQAEAKVLQEVARVWRREGASLLRRDRVRVRARVRVRVRVRARVRVRVRVRIRVFSKRFRSRGRFRSRMRTTPVGLQLFRN